MIRHINALPHDSCRNRSGATASTAAAVTSAVQSAPKAITPPDQRDTGKVKEDSTLPIFLSLSLSLFNPKNTLPIFLLHSSSKSLRISFRDFPSCLPHLFSALPSQ